MLFSLGLAAFSKARLFAPGLQAAQVGLAFQRPSHRSHEQWILSRMFRGSNAVPERFGLLGRVVFVSLDF